mgnify:CR=1 FL=1
MRKTIIAAVASLSLLAGCSTVQVTNFLSQVQSATATACAFVPTLDTILNVAAALGIPAAGITGAAINTIANVICHQVPPPASARYRSLATPGGPAQAIGSVNGVVIQGWRTR